MVKKRKGEGFMDSKSLILFIWAFFYEEHLIEGNNELLFIMFEIFKSSYNFLKMSQKFILVLKFGKKSN